jgi:hypothetical protein
VSGCSAPCCLVNLSHHGGIAASQLAIRLSGSVAARVPCLNQATLSYAAQK